ncbi:MAG: hypothetical protein AAGE96_09890 [Cyanobacteria bacterium P01_G01_bin.19]
MRSYFPYWNFTSCIHTDSRNKIRSAIINLFEQEQECFFIPKIPYLILNPEKIEINYFYQRFLVNPYERPQLLIVGLGIGREGWTIIKTYPNDWLFLRTPDGKRPRLSALAMQLECDAFHYRVTDNDESLFLETDATGKFRIEHTDQLKYKPDFSLIRVSNSLHRAMQINRYSISVDELDGIEASEYERIDHFLMKALDPFEYYWQTYDLFEEVYCDFEKLNEMNVKLMYFHPPKYYLESLPIYREQIEDYWHEAQFRNDTEAL